MTTPAFDSLTKIAGEGWENIPDAPLPYYLGATDGLWLHRRLQIGRGMVKQKYWPDNWPKVGFGDGKFLFTAPPIPANLMGQIVSFFQRIYERQKTEAAVLLTINAETNEWGVFIPTQMVSHGGVNYVFDPAHIKYPRLLVGSIHSHADFSPFHSGTDTNDAADFDGFHGTIGFVNKEPKIVAMIALNKQFMHYHEADFPSLFDWSEIDKHPAPEWWDQYVERQGSTTKPVGYELYAKFAKPTVVKNHVNTGAQSASGWNYHQGSGWNYNGNQPYGTSETYRPGSDSGIKAMTVYHGPTSDTPRSDWDDDFGMDQMIAWREYLNSRYGREDTDDPRALKESKDFNARRAAERGANWGKDGSLRRIGRLDENFWEDILVSNMPDRSFLDNVLELASEDDIDIALMSPQIGGDPKFWIERLLDRAMQIGEFLKSSGVDITMTVNSPSESRIWSMRNQNEKKSRRQIRRERRNNKHNGDFHHGAR